MASLRRLAPYVWRAQWRVLRGKGKARQGNPVLIGVMAVMGCVALSVFDAMAVHFLRRGLVDPARASLALLLGTAATGWFLVPVFSQAAGAVGEGATVDRFMRYPFSQATLFRLLLLTRAMHPICWSLAVVSITVLVPIFFAPSPLIGLVGAVAYLCSAALGGLALQLSAGAVVTSRPAKMVGRVLSAVLAVSLYVVVIGVRMTHRDGAFRIGLWDHERVLIDDTGRDGVVVALRGWSPADLAARAAVDGDVFLGVFPFAILAGAFVALSRWSLRRTLIVPEIGGARQGRRLVVPLPFVPPRVAALVRKELAYTFRNHDPYVSLLAAWAAATYYARRGAPEWMVWLAMGYAVLALSPSLFNAFGFDRTGVARYFLLPVTGEEVLGAKNLSLALRLAAMLLPGVVTIAVVAGPLPAAGAIATAATLVMLSAIIANSFSVRNPVPRRFGTLGGERYASSLPLSLAFTLLLGAPIGLHVLVSVWSPAAAGLVECAMAVLVGVVYRRSLRRAGGLFERSAAHLCERLSD